MKKKQTEKSLWQRITEKKIERQRKIANRKKI